MYDDTQFGLIRRLELDAVRRWFRSGQRVLELGGGNGYQASLLRSWGCDVASIDIAPGDACVFPVQQYDGANIPFGDDTFDVVFSSNVLEHIEDLSGILAEIKRVLKPNGVAVHVLPSPVWRGVTHVERYAVWLRDRFPSSTVASRGPDAAARCEEKGGAMGFAMRATLGEPHGEYSSALAEVYYYSSFRWTRTFRENGFDIESVDGGPLFYSGFGLLPIIRISQRRPHHSSMVRLDLDHSRSAHCVLMTWSNTDALPPSVMICGSITPCCGTPSWRDP